MAYLSESSSFYLVISLWPLIGFSEIISLPPLDCSPLYSSVPGVPLHSMIIIYQLFYCLTGISWRAVGTVLQNAVWHVAGTLLSELTLSHGCEQNSP